MLDWLSRAWSQGKQRWADMRIDAHRRDELAYEIACLERAGELDGALSNFGLGRGAVPFLLRRYPGAVRRHAASCQRLRIANRSQNASGLGALNGAQLRCLLCPSARRCEKWLRGSDDDLRAFCPNRSAFEDQISAVPAP
jgi:hypothetical protein